MVWGALSKSCRVCVAAHLPPPPGVLPGDGVGVTSQCDPAPGPGGPLPVGLCLPPVPTEPAGEDGPFPSAGDPAHAPREPGAAGQDPHAGEDGAQRRRGAGGPWARQAGRRLTGGSAVFWLQAVEFLSKAVDSPNIKAVDEAVILLQEIGEWAGPGRALERLSRAGLTAELLQGCWTSGST